MINYIVKRIETQNKIFCCFKKKQEQQKRNKIIKSRTNTIIAKQNKNNSIINFNVDKVVYNFNFKIDYFKYFLELFFVELLQKHNTRKNNKINLK